jgi:hypothetical protein
MIARAESHERDKLGCNAEQSRLKPGLEAEGQRTWPRRNQGR